jgi:hypothetical protein
MSELLSTFFDIVVSEEIERIVTEAAKGGSMIVPTTAAGQIVRSYPASGLSKREIADQILRAAIKAGVAVEIGRYDEAA